MNGKSQLHLEVLPGATVTGTDGTWGLASLSFSFLIAPFMHVRIRATLYQGDTILRLAEMCRKLETEEEKVHVWILR